MGTENTTANDEHELNQAYPLLKTVRGDTPPINSHSAEEIITALTTLKQYAQEQKTAGVELVGGVYTEDGKYIRFHDSGGHLSADDPNKLYLDDPIIPAIDQTLDKLNKLNKLQLPDTETNRMTVAMIVDNNLRPYAVALNKINHLKVDNDLSNTRYGKDEYEKQPATQVIETLNSYNKGLREAMHPPATVGGAKSQESPSPTLR